MGRYTVHLVGESRYQQAVRQLSPGDPVDLVHEPDNRSDPRAIVARDVTGSTIGYCPAGHWVGRVVIDERSRVAAAVSAIIGGEKGKPSRGVILEVRTAAEIDGPAALLPDRARVAPAVQEVHVRTSMVTWVGVVALVLLVATCALGG